MAGGLAGVPPAGREAGLASRSEPNNLECKTEKEKGSHLAPLRLMTNPVDFRRGFFLSDAIAV